MLSIPNIEEKIEEVSHLLKHLSHPKRFHILCKLREGPKTVGDLEKHCHISQSQLSQFLIKMRDEGLLSSEKHGQFVEYSIRDEKVRSLINEIQKIFCNPL